MNATAATLLKLIITSTNELILGGGYQLFKTKELMMGMPLKKCCKLKHIHTKKIYDYPGC